MIGCSRDPCRRDGRGRRDNHGEQEDSQPKWCVALDFLEDNLRVSISIGQLAGMKYKAP